MSKKEVIHGLVDIGAIKHQQMLNAMNAGQEAIQSTLRDKQHRAVAA